MNEDSIGDDVDDDEMIEEDSDENVNILDDVLVFDELNSVDIFELLDVLDDVLVVDTQVVHAAAEPVNWISVVPPLVVKVRSADPTPATLGDHVTETVVVAPAAIVAPLAGKFEETKSFPTTVELPGTTTTNGEPGTLGLVYANEVNAKAPAPSFVIVKVLVTLCPTVEVPKSSVYGLTTGNPPEATTFPESDTVVVNPRESTMLNAAPSVPGTT